MMTIEKKTQKYENYEKLFDVIPYTKHEYTSKPFPSNQSLIYCFFSVKCCNLLSKKK